MTKREIQRRVAAGRLHRVYRGVYAVGHAALSPRGKELAAVLACGPGAVLSHRSAARLWGLVPSVPVVEVTAARSRKHKAGVRVHRSRTVGSEDRAQRDGVPVTSVARTLVDLADVVTERRLAEAIHEAEVQRLFDLNHVRSALARVPGRRGRHRLERVLDAYDHNPAITRSEAERRFLQLCSSHRLPLPQANALVGGYEVDFLWAAAGVAVEVDGVAVHYTPHAFHTDRKRDRHLAAHGVHVVRVTWNDITEEPKALADQLAAILGRC